MKLITPDAWDMIEAAEWADKGQFPLGGGWLLQTRSCIDGIRLVRAEESHYKAKLNRK